MVSSYFIDVVKVIAITCVVAQHVILPWYGADCLAFQFCAVLGAPPFFLVAGYLSHSQPVLPYYMKKFWRISVPFFVFCALKILFSLITDINAHADSFGGMLYDAFILGRLYWFAYTILWLFLLAPILWRIKSPLFVLLLAVGLYVTMYFAPWIAKFRILQMHHFVRALPLFIIGYALRLCVEPNKKTRGASAIKLIAKYTWQIMLMEGFLRIVLFVVVPIPSGVMRIVMVPVLTIVLMLFCIGVSIVSERIPVVRKLVGV